jgi:hypothetical protein
VVTISARAGKAGPAREEWGVHIDDKTLYSVSLTRITHRGETDGDGERNPFGEHTRYALTGAT